TTTGVQVLNTLILFVVGLPIVDLFYRSDSALVTEPEARKRYFSYEAARKDGVAFMHWWNCYIHQWELTQRAIYLPEPGNPASYRLRPNSRSVFFQCPISINSKGFRGKEIAEDKGPAYRIVALGESTTFGLTLGPDDRPWPELLEQLIAQRLGARRPAGGIRPVEVINAGVPGYDIVESVGRMERDILPLKPDMVISYHGINGFRLLYEALPPLVAPPPPAYVARPLQLLADGEYRLKLLVYAHPALS